MSKGSHLHALKLNLANYGAIRPQAWAKILAHLKEAELKVDESFNREINSIAYVTSGLLKEYDVQFRKKPSIVNFISAGNFLITTKHNQSKYLKAITGTTLVYLEFDDLFSIFSKYNELKPIYDSILANYEEGISFRYILLEERITEVRIQQFITKHRAILSLLKKKDIANYINLEYDYFIRKYGKLL